MRICVVMPINDTSITPPSRFCHLERSDRAAFPKGNDVAIANQPLLPLNTSF
jgi:hypothetical protein